MYFEFNIVNKTEFYNRCAHFNIVLYFIGLAMMTNDLAETVADMTLLKTLGKFEVKPIPGFSNLNTVFSIKAQ